MEKRDDDGGTGSGDRRRPEKSGRPGSVPDVPGTAGGPAARPGPDEPGDLTRGAVPVREEESTGQSAAVLDAFFAGAESDAVLVPEDTPPGHRSGYVALVGRPNVGKSTLMNGFLEQRIAIVTPKPQTTRRKTLGILSTDRFQLVILDTPGIMEPRYALHEAMLREAREALAEADVVVVLVDATKPLEVLPTLEGLRAPMLLALNKVDRAANKAELLPLLDGYAQTGLFAELIPISALRGDGVDELLEAIVARLPEGPLLYPRDQISEQPERFFVAEIVRERIFRLYEQEVPYSTEVLVTHFEERTQGKDYIEATVFVETDSQKAILIGRHGQAIRQLGEEARVAIEAFLDRPVYLRLDVKTMPKWRKKAGSLKKLGYRG